SAVTWAVNGMVGGNSTLGTIGATGNFKAPPVPPPGYMVTVSATSVEDASKSASAKVYVIYAKPTIASINPWSVPLGAFTITVAGSNYVNGAQVLMNGVPLQTQFTSMYYLNASGNATANG